MNENTHKTDRKRVVIIGGGYAGVKLARELRNTEFEVYLIDKNNYHQFQPLFYQVAAAGLEANSISFPFRKMFQNYNNFHFRLAEVKEIFTEKNEIVTDIGNILYDYLIIATGTDNNFFDNKNIEKYSFPLKSISESLKLRNKLLQNNEDALTAKDAEERKGLLTVVIVGGGPTGIEVAGSLSEMRKHVLPLDYPELDFKEMEIYLFDSSPRLLKTMSEISSSKSKEYLEKLGVHLRFNSRIKDYDGKYVYLPDGSKLRASTLIWAAGVACRTFDGLKYEPVGRGKRIPVDRYNRIEGYDNIFAIGDVSYMTEEKFPEGHPQLAEVAIQQAKLLAKNLKSIQVAAPMKEFSYNDIGIMATIGRNRAVVELPFLKFQGLPAWFFFMFVHLMSILVVKNRLFKFLKWAFRYFTYDSSLRLIYHHPKKED